MRTIVLGDFHLHHGDESTSSRDFLRLVDSMLREGPLNIVLSGDIYDLAMAGDAPVADRLTRIVRDQPSFHRALANVVASGGEVAIVPGNHDYELLLAPDAFEALVPGARVQPWFIRVHGHTHVEHGNMYDPDNAHPHPTMPEGDPLGIMITRQILARLGDLKLLHTSGKTPLPVLWHCFVNYGLRTPAMVARYVTMGLRQTFRKKPATATGFSPTAAITGQSTATETEKALRELHPWPTHLHGPTLFARMYLDRILTTIALGGAAIGASFVAPRMLPWIGGVGAATLLIMQLRGNRYGGRVEALLQKAAHAVAERTGARHVVFGHSHVAHDDGVYLNTGSFGFPGPSGLRDFVEVDRHGARHRTMQPGGLASDRRPRARSALYAYAQKRLGRSRPTDTRPSDRTRAKRRPKG